MKSSLRAGAWGAWARAFFNLVQAAYIALYVQFIPDGEQYNPVVLKANIPLLYVEPVLMIGMSFGLIVAVWTLFDLMHDHAHTIMRLSLATTIICGAALFFVAANAITRFDSLFVIEGYSLDQQSFALHILDMIAVLLGHVMVTTHALSTLLWAYAGWRSGVLSKALSLTGMIVGALALVFEFTPVNLLGFLLQVPLFIWLGTALWRKSRSVQPSPSISISYGT